MKEQMTTMMEAMMSMRKIMEVNTTTVVAARIAIEVHPTHPPGFNQVNHPALDMVGDVAPCGACRPWMFFINGALCFLKIMVGEWRRNKDDWR